MVRSALLLAAVAGTLGAQSRFEGAVSMTLPGENGRANDATYLMKDGTVRVEMAGPRGEQAVVIFDAAAKQLLMVMPSEKMYIVQSFDAVAGMAQRKAAQVTVTPTGTKETIAGHECEHVTVSDDSGTADVCVAHGLGTWQMPTAGGMRGGPPQAEAWQSALGADAFPLQVSKGTQTVMLVTRIDAKSLDASLFAAPDGYTKMDMGSMMRRP